MCPIYSCLPLESIGQPFRKLFLHIFKPLCLCLLTMHQELAKAAQEPPVHICPRTALGGFYTSGIESSDCSKAQQVRTLLTYTAAC